MRRTSTPTSTSTTPITSSSTRRWTELQEPVVRCFVEAGPPDPRLSPRAASELLGGVLFSLIFAPSEVTSDSPLPEDRVERATLAIRLFLGGYWSLARGEDQRA